MGTARVGSTSKLPVYGNPTFGYVIATVAIEKYKDKFLTIEVLKKEKPSSFHVLVERLVNPGSSVQGSP